MRRSSPLSHLAFRQHRGQQCWSPSFWLQLHAHSSCSGLSSHRLLPRLLICAALAGVSSPCRPNHLTLRSRGTLRKRASPARSAPLTFNVSPFVPMPAFRAPSCRLASADFRAPHRAWFSGSVGRASSSLTCCAPLSPLASSRGRPSSGFSRAILAAVAGHALHRRRPCERHRLTWRSTRTLRDKAAQRRLALR